MLLARAHLQLLVLSGLCLGLALPACTVNSTETTTSTTGVGATGGTGTSSNNGASGGIGVGGEGATGGQGGTGVGAGGSGGNTQCVGGMGTGQTEAACDNSGTMPIAGAANTCGAGFDQPPPGLAVCHHAFDIYLPGDAESLYDCLAMISVAPDQACSDTNVQNCVTKVHTEACDVPEVQTSCKDLVKACNDAGDASLTEANCNFLLAPFNDTALADIQACERAAMEGDCKTTLETCWDQVATIP